MRMMRLPLLKGCVRTKLVFKTETSQIIIAQGFSWNRPLRHSRYMGSFKSFALWSLVFCLKNRELNVLCVMYSVKISVMMT